MTKKIHHVTSLILMIFLLSSCGANKSEEVARAFLNQYYQITEEDVLTFSELKGAMSQDAYEAFNEGLYQTFSELVDQEELKRMAQNRVLSQMIQYAYENSTLFKPSALTLEKASSEKDYDVYNYQVDLLETKSNASFSLSGMLKIETLADGTLITYTELGSPYKP